MIPIGLTVIIANFIMMVVLLFTLLKVRGIISGSVWFDGFFELPMSFLIIFWLYTVVVSIVAIVQYGRLQEIINQLNQFKP